MNKKGDSAMVACPRCMARFESTSERERDWYLRHLARAHGEARARRFRPSARPERANFTPAA